MLMPDEKRLRPDCKSDEGFHQRRERAAAALESCTASQPLNASEQHLLRYCSCTDGAFGMQRYTPYGAFGMVSPPIQHLACSGTADVPVEHLVAADEALEEEKDVAETGREENADPEEEEAVPEEKKIASEDEGTKKKNPKTKKAVRRISHPTQPSSFWSIWYAAVLAAVLLLHWWSIWMQLEGKGSSGGGRSRKKQLRRRKNRKKQLLRSRRQLLKMRSLKKRQNPRRQAKG